MVKKKLESEVDEVYGMNMGSGWPPLSLVFSPLFLIRSAWDFFINWITSRRYLHVALGLPALIVAAAVFAGGLQLWRTHQNKAITTYRKAVYDASQEDDTKTWELALNTLIQLDPQDTANRMNLALFRAKQGKNLQATAMMRSLASEAYEPARLWLAGKFLLSPNGQLQAEAIQNLRDVVSDNPSHPAANAMLGEIYLAQNKLHLAERCLRKVSEKNPGARLMLATATARLGRKHVAELELKKAITELKNNIETDPTQIRTRIQLAEALKMQGKLLQSQTVLVEGLKTTPDDEQLRKAFGKSIALNATFEQRRGSADKERMQTLLLKALEYAPQILTIVDQLEQTGLKPGVARPEVVQAVADRLDEFEEKVGESPQIDVKRAWTLRMQGKDELAIASMEKAVAKLPGLRLRYAGMLKAMGRSEDAAQQTQQYLKTVRELLSNNPDDARIRILLANGLLFDQQVAAAQSVLEEGPKDDPNLKEALLRIVLRQAATSTDRSQKLNYLLKVVELNRENRLLVDMLAGLSNTPDEVGNAAVEQLYDLLADGVFPTHINSILGGVFVARDDYEKALPYFERAQRLAPNDPVICNNLAHVLANVAKPDLDRGIELLNRAVELFPENPEVFETRGEILIKQSKFDEALVSLLLALEKSPREDDNLDVHGLLAEAYKGVGNSEMEERHRKKAAAAKGT